MEIEFDPTKDLRNQRKHGLSLAEVSRLDFESAAVILDERREYSEIRYRAYGRIEGRLYMLAFTMRGEILRAIPLGRPMGERRSAMGDDPDLIQDDQNPEWTEKDFAKAIPFKNMFPEQFQSWARERDSRTAKDAQKVHVGFDFAVDVVEGIKATGPDYSVRVEKLLRDALAQGKL